MNALTQLAVAMFNAYNEQGPNPWKTFDGREVPRWDGLNDQVRAKWLAAAEASLVPPAATGLFPPEVIAEACHEANRVLTKHVGDVPVQPHWADAPPDMKASSISGVEWRLENITAPASAQHDQWMREKLIAGWTLGEKRDTKLKTHPALVPYEQLEPGTRAKDGVFSAIVRALR